VFPGLKRKEKLGWSDKSVKADGARTFLSAAMCFGYSSLQIRVSLTFKACCGQECQYVSI
jgi:hypothetical protein